MIQFQGERMALSLYPNPSGGYDYAMTDASGQVATGTATGTPTEAANQILAPLKMHIVNGAIVKQ